jgi:threonine dehydratase
MPQAAAPPDFSDVIRAAERIAGAAHPTPVLTSSRLNEVAGAELFFKCENLQRAGAFKFRGAYNSIAALSAAERAKGVVAYSSGNHAQALALASRLQGAPAIIVMPHDAPAMKVAATRGYGAEVRFYDRYTESREEIARALAEGRGLTLIPPYDHAEVIAGQGTAAMELIEEVGPLDMLITPLGGGGLLAGTALVAGALAPSCKVVGVEPEAGDDGLRSFRSGEIVRIPVPRTIADGAMTTYLGELTFAIIRTQVDDIVTVSDDALVEAMRLLAQYMKLIVEPTGCLAAAAALGRGVGAEGKRVGIILSGGNVDLATFARLTGRT